MNDNREICDNLSPILLRYHLLNFIEKRVTAVCFRLTFAYFFKQLFNVGCRVINSHDFITTPFV